MNHFGRIADDLTALEESIDQMLDMPHVKPLKASLQRAFVEACKASRALRLAEQEAQQVGTPRAEHSASKANMLRYAQKQISASHRA